MREIKFIPVIIALAFLIPASLAQAEDSHSVASAQVDYAKKLTTEGNPSAAQEHFLKALLLDTHQEEAKDYLRKASADEKVGTLKDRLVLQRLVDLVDYVDFLKTRITFFDKSNTQFMSLIAQKAKPDSEFQTQLKTIQEDLKKNVTLSAENLTIISPEEIEKTLDTTRMTLRLASLREKLLAQINYLQAVNTQLFNLKSSLAQELAGAPALATQSAGLTALKEELTQKEEALQKQNQSLAQFDSSVKSLRSELDTLQAKMEEANQKLSDVTKKLAAMTLESYEKDRRLADSEKQAAGMTQQLAETTERLNLAQRLLKEKDQALAKDNQSVPGVKDDETQEKIEKLEVALKDLNAKYTDLAARMEQKDQKIIDLKLLAVEKDQRLIDLRNAFASKDQKVTEMSGILTIYRWKLGALAAQLKERENKIDKMEKMLNSVDRELGQRLKQDLSKSPPPNPQRKNDFSKPVAVESGPWPPENILSDLQTRLNSALSESK